MSQRYVRVGARLQQRWISATSAARTGRESGMTTAEYAVGTLAAVAFAAVLMAVVKSGAVKSALTSIIESALSVAG
ncbi:DUF4244 domain-containing protein [Rudaeicoccus suwonensis]|uniref:Uncharacterized protein DUF4244 n=1 Tax=Rudaeicoccus suwonensis TaxID=657409 RepID=A0A561E320_9MICO|nr:DUF4244 domain-containing protein [Rudaeicoccus suwonensis]TWE10000.1 uncharacterized protein DUF4244 [Rudaeicoccus suwonensis]